MISCIDMVAQKTAGKIIVRAITEPEIGDGDVVCYVREGEDPCLAVARGSDRVVIMHEGREQFVMVSALKRVGYRFLGGLRLG